MAIDAVPARRTLTELRDNLHERLDRLLSEPPTPLIGIETVAQDAAHLARALLDLDQVIHANQPPPGPPGLTAATVAKVLSTVWHRLQDVGYPTSTSDNVVGILRELPPFALVQGVDENLIGGSG